MNMDRNNSSPGVQPRVSQSKPGFIVSNTDVGQEMVQVGSYVLGLTQTLLTVDYLECRALRVGKHSSSHLDGC